MSVPTLDVQFVPYAAAQAVIDQIRTAVFQQEQGVPAELEFDGRDAAAGHVVAYWAGQPVGTARWRNLPELPNQPQVKIERVAILKSHRGQGFGHQLMVALLDYLQQAGITHVKIHAQTPVQQFYERLGFTVTSPVFEEAGIPHVAMAYRPTKTSSST